MRAPPSLAQCVDLEEQGAGDVSLLHAGEDVVAVLLVLEAHQAFSVPTARQLLDGEVLASTTRRSFFMNDTVSQPTLGCAS